MWLGEESKSGLKTGNWCQIVDSSSVKGNTPYIYVYQAKGKKANRLELIQKAGVILF
jgi:hypothetical protein